MKKRLLVLIGIIVVIFLGFFGWQAINQRVVTKPTSIRQPHYVEKKTVSLVAIGDSLTYGQGDEDKNGGYVSLVKRRIENHYRKTTVKTANYGVSGDRSDQILARLNGQKKIRQDLKHADVITMTVGGNDLMQNLEKDALSSPKTVDKDVAKAQTTYRQHLNKLFKSIRQQNPQAPIFVMSIYNPFYVYFPNASTINDSITKWNQTTQGVMSDYSKMYFVNIDQLMSYGQYKTTAARRHLLNEEKAANQGKTSQQQILTIMGKKDHNINAYISTEDNFHPNHRGYQMISKKLFHVMQEHDSWEYVKR